MADQKRTVKLEMPKSAEERAAKADLDQRASLVDAFEVEIETHRKHAAKCSKNEWFINESISIEIGNSLGRILENWVEGYKHERIKKGSGKGD